MDVENRPQWRPEPEPQNALEKLIVKAATDPAVHGRLMRTLWDSEIHTLLPYHPELVGTHELQNGQQVEFIVLQDATGPFIPAFSSEAAAEYCIETNGSDMTFGLATFPGPVFFSLVKGMERAVVFNSGMKHNLVLKPEALDALVKGDLRHSRPSRNPGETTTLFPVEEASLPPSLLDGIRSFCDRNNVPIAVYLFLPADPATGEVITTELRLILRLRVTDHDFYNDFSLMVNRLLPRGLELAVGVVTDDESALAFLQTQRPVWPVL